MRMRLIVISGLFGSTIFLHISLQTARFSGGGGEVIEHKNCALIFSMTFSETIPVFMYSTRYSCHILKKPEFSRQIFEKYSKFHENLSIRSRHVTCGRTDGLTDRRSDGRTDTTKLIVAFRNSTTRPTKNRQL
jgi:hypothetical protein